jgi:hypothetical protein
MKMFIWRFPINLSSMDCGSEGLPQSDFPNVHSGPMRNGIAPRGMFPYADWVIDKAIDREYILDNFNCCMKKIQEREQNWNF